MNLYHNTPIFASHYLKQNKDLNVYYKMDCHQPSGSFKIRGMDHFCRHHITNGHTKFVASSGGNAGYSLAYVCQLRGASVKVIVPKTTTSFMIDKIEALGSEVEVFGESWNEADMKAREYAQNDHAIYAPPFDDALLWQGHASVIDECAKEMQKPDKIVLSVGGGGLLGGVLYGLKRNNWHDIKIITMETEGAASFFHSYKKGERVELEKIDSIATSLGAKKVSKDIFELSKKFDIKPLTVDDNTAMRACKQFLNEYNTMVEPACGASLSYTYFNEQIKPEEKILVIVCGGVNLSIDKFNALCERGFRS